MEGPTLEKGPLEGGRAEEGGEEGGEEREEAFFLEDGEWGVCGGMVTIFLPFFKNLLKITIR